MFGKQIPAGLNLCMTGFPYWTTDIGAFRVTSQEKGGNQGKGEIGEFRGEAGSSDGGGYKKGLRDSCLFGAVYALVSVRGVLSDVPGSWNGSAA